VRERFLEKVRRLLREIRDKRAVRGGGKAERERGDQ
jgi:hypothetical protein